MENRKFPHKLWIGTEPETVSNPYTGDTCTLPPDAVAVYDFTKGCELISDWAGVQAGCDWFRQHFPAEYYTLLD